MPRIEDEVTVLSGDELDVLLVSEAQVPDTHSLVTRYLRKNGLAPKKDIVRHLFLRGIPLFATEAALNYLVNEEVLVKFGKSNGIRYGIKK